jgi:hypothetical protein
MCLFAEGEFMRSVQGADGVGFVKAVSTNEGEDKAAKVAIASLIELYAVLLEGIVGSSGDV